MSRPILNIHFLQADTLILRHTCDKYVIEYLLNLQKSMMRRAEILVRGLVQGVFYRHSTKKKADEFRLSGTVRNLRDGRVEVICEGSEEDIGKLFEWCKHGPQGAVVEHVDIVWKEYTGEFKDFRIL
jgi:acylphosphatase